MIVLATCACGEAKNVTPLVINRPCVPICFQKHMESTDVCTLSE